MIGDQKFFGKSSNQRVVNLIQKSLRREIQLIWLLKLIFLNKCDKDDRYLPLIYDMNFKSCFIVREIRN